MSLDEFWADLSPWERRRWARHERQHERAAAAQRARRPRPPRRSPWRRWRRVLAVALMVAVIWWVHGRTFVTHAGPGPDHAESYAFLRHQSVDPSQPVAYSPCRPVHFVVNDTQAPKGAYRLTVDAIHEIARATGLTFVVDGHTGEMPTGDRPIGESPAWTPVLVVWTDPVVDPGLEGSVAGRAGSTAVRSPTSGVEVYVSGTARIDAPSMAGYLRRGDVAEVRGVLLHELGHVVGLDHVDDKSQVMYHASTVGELGSGDRAGLARLGHGPCLG